jgi:hypothetical protein
MGSEGKEHSILWYLVPERRHMVSCIVNFGREKHTLFPGHLEKNIRRVIFESRKKTHGTICRTLRKTEDIVFVSGVLERTHINTFLGIFGKTEPIVGPCPSFRNREAIVLFPVTFRTRRHRCLAMTFQKERSHHLSMFRFQEQRNHSYAHYCVLKGSTHVLFNRHL